MTMQPAPVSEDFRLAVAHALQQASRFPDDAVQYMSYKVPVYMAPGPTQQQAVAGGCPNCTYLGLWAASWPGLPTAPHGMIWLFEDGIRKMGGNLHEQVNAVLLHEYDHALQRDHVLDAMKLDQQRGLFRPYRPCGGCPGR
jgi:hypothetical protein